MIFWLGLAALAQAGELHGQLVDPDGEPVVGATVVAYDQRLNNHTALTDSTGTYRFEGLLPHLYRIRVLPARADNLVEQYLPEGVSICEGEPFHLDGERVDLGTTTLSWGGEIEGILQDSDGQPVVGAQVGARPVQGEPQFGARYSTSDAEGRYLIRGVAPGFIHKLDISAIGWPRQLAPGVYVEELARPFLLVEGVRHAAGITTLLNGVALSGEVHGPDGPVQSGEVQASAPGQSLIVPIRDGAFEVVGLPPGDILLRATSPGLGQTWYPDLDRPGPRISSVEDQVIEDVRLDLPLAGAITGQLKAEGELNGVSVLAYNDDQSLGFSGMLGENGEFAVRGLHPGAYSLQILGAAAGLRDTQVLDAQGGLLQLDVPPGGVADFGEIPLAPAAQIHGTVQHLYEGTPIYGAQVFAQPIDRDTGYVTSTRADGYYRFPGLTPGTWRLWAEYQAWCGPDPDHAPRYYPDQVNRLFIGSVTLRPGQKVEWNPTLPPDHDHDKMDDVWEEQHGLDPARDDGDEDPDGDGYTNYEEYLLGTDPLRAEDGPPCTCEGSRAALWMGPALWLWLRVRRRSPLDAPRPPP